MLVQENMAHYQGIDFAARNRLDAQVPALEKIPCAHNKGGKGYSRWKLTVGYFAASGYTHVFNWDPEDHWG